MVSDKAKFRLLSALSQFKEECDGGSDPCVEKVTELESALKGESEQKSEPKSDGDTSDAKSSFAKAGKKSAEDYFGKKKDEEK